MGASVDLDAPIITVSQMKTGTNTTHTSFETSIYCNKDVVFYGTAEDNQKVTNVKVEIKWSDEDTYQFLKNAELNKNDWSVELSLAKEGACSLKFVAEDRSGNYSAKSAKIVTLFVDNNAPSAESWYIDRLNNGIQYSLQSLDALKNIISKDPELTQPSNIDVAQNVQFDICSAFSDQSGIKNVSISIFDENGNKILAKVPNSAGTNYAPRFRITHSDLVAANASLATGLHYLRVCYNAEDTVTAPGSNTVQDSPLDLGWFIWWPESDNPKYSIPELQTDSFGHKLITLPIDSSLTITLFDDDGLVNSMSCEFDDDREESKRKTTATANENEREHVLSLKAPGIPQRINLKINAQAVSGKALQNIVIPVNVTDESIPNLILTSPENNKIPSVTGSLADPEIQFTGQTLDKANCKYLEFVWVPDSVQNKQALAAEWLDYRLQNSLNSEPSDNVELITGTGKYDGLKLWSIKLTPDNSNPADVFKKKTFDFNLKLKTDFISKGKNEQALDKYFLIRLIREDGNFADSEFKLAADNLEPVIEPDYPKGNMAIVDKDEQLTIKFKVSKDSELPLETCALYYVSKDGSAETPITITPNNQTVYASGTTFTAATIDNDTLQTFLNRNENPRYRYYAKDILGNEKSETYQFIISDKPKLQSINSSAATKCKKDDVIYINVSFSKTVKINSDDKPQLKLKGIVNGTQTADDIVYADYDSGSGTTTLVFKYTVQEGDVSSELQVYNEEEENGTVIGPVLLDDMESLGAHLNTLEAENNLQSKRSDNPITIDGITPVVESMGLQTLVDATNVVGGVKYLKAGRTLTATVKVSKEVKVQGAPTFKLSVGSSTIELPWQSVEQDTTDNTKYNLIFSKKVASDDENGAITYNEADSIQEIGVIKDDYGNVLINTLTSSCNPKFYIDTNVPKQPVVTNTTATPNVALATGKYPNRVKFTISNPSTDGDKAFDTIQFDTEGGRTFDNYSEEQKLTSNASVVARIIDRAGNVSKYAGPYNLEINSTFPTFTVECTNPDGKYKAGTKLNFKVYFTAPVNIPANCTAYIALNNGQNALLKKTNGVVPAQNGVTTAEFEYTVSTTDEFTLIIAANAIHLTGFVDEYGFTQGTGVLATAYTRNGIHCDGVAPYVVSMVPDGTKTTADDGKNIYTNGRKIVITFSEPVSAVSGKIYLRQTAGWAIPPVLTASEFNTICSSFPSDYAEEGKNILSIQENGIDMEDSAWDSFTDAGRVNSGYHGTGQYVGPYKKSTLGVDDNGNPDTSTKYVLDFDMDIWETTEEHYYGKSFTPLTNEYDDTNARRITVDNKINEQYSAPSTYSRTANDIRTALEKAHYHERYMSVAAATIDGNTVTLEFPADLFGNEALSYGRKWQLIIEKGSFMDLTGNNFGANSNTKEIFINEGENCTNDYFWSDGVATPVIRVDRYSYGAGIFQSNENAVESQIGLDERTEPSCFVRVRIDCETEGAVISYNSDGATKEVSNVSNVSDYSSNGYKEANSYLTTTNGKSILDGIVLTANENDPVLTKSADGSMPEIKFALGSGNYKKSYKGYVKAKSTKPTNDTETTYTSEDAKEGIFQTVVCIQNPTRGNDSLATDASLFSIRGTSGLAGEPIISPFPLRDNQLHSPFIRHTFREAYKVNNSNDFYWVSYEILIYSSFSGHTSRATPGWIAQWGTMKPGEFTLCVDMQTW